MTLDIWIAYMGVVLLFMIAPGPSHLLMISVGLRNGFRRSLATAAGDLSANAIQMTLAGVGLATALVASRYGFVVVKWAGVAYLVWMGVRQVMSSSRGTSVAAGTDEALSSAKLWLMGFLTSAANPKAVVFFAALFPQFIDPARALLPQLAVLGGTYLVVDGLFLSAYGWSAGKLGARASRGRRTLVERLSGWGPIGSAGLLALKSPASSSG